MADITHNDPVVTESKLTEFYNDIKPFLGCPAYLTSEGTSNYYSTEEKVIGRWTNGKPLYQKVINGNLPSSAGSTGYPHNISNADEFTCVKGIVFWGGHESTEMPVINANSKAPVIFIPSINNSTVLITVDSDRSSTTFAIIIQYTKTTDSASTTIQEDPNEYSTDEKIIGKWIDGKPIYQKTYQFDTVSTSNSLGMTINPENIINFFGTVTNVENECLTLNCAHPLYQDIYGLLTCIKSSTIEVRSINSREWSLNNLRSLKITLQYTKDSD